MSGNGDDNEDITDPNLEDPSTTGDDARKPGANGGGDDKQETVSKASYTSLQRVLNKRDEELGTLRGQLEQALEAVEELKSNQSSSEKAQEQAAEKLRELQEQLDAAETDRSKLQKQVSQQGILLEEFPDLAPFAEYIPSSDDEEGYKANAKNFSEALEAFVEKKVQSTLDGSAPPPPDGNRESPNQAKIDRAYDKAMKLAGIPGKESEYEKAWEEYLELVPE